MIQTARLLLWKPVFDVNLRLIQACRGIGCGRSSCHSIDPGQLSRTASDGSDCCGCEIARFGGLYRNQRTSGEEFVAIFEHINPVGGTPRVLCRAARGNISRMSAEGG